MYETLIMQVINDFTCSLTNHNELWLNIYKAGMLYLANSVFRHIYAVHMSMPAYSAMLQLEAVCNEIRVTYR